MTYIYRDTLTGRFAKKAAWKRSKARGGKRYKREKVKRKKRLPPPPRGGPVWEWIVTFTYRSGRTFDVIVTARTEQEAYKVAEQFLRADKEGSRIVRAGYHGWDRRAARGSISNENVGEAEYRSESKV
jgi:hypothetical protein